jgi:hypothetical protein
LAALRWGATCCISRRWHKKLSIVLLAQYLTLLSCHAKQATPELRFYTKYIQRSHGKCLAQTVAEKNIILINLACIKNITVLKKLFNIVFNRPPLFYGLFYLSLIPLFAFIYAALPRQFYHSTAPLEHSLIDERTQEIQNEMKIQIQKMRTRNFISSDTAIFRIDFTYISLQNLKYNKDTFFFDLVYRHPDILALTGSQSSWFHLYFYQVPQIQVDPMTQEWTEINYIIHAQEGDRFLDSMGFNNVVRAVFNGTSSALYSNP